MAANSTTPVETVRYLLEDDDAEVRDAAAQALANRRQAAA